MRFGEVDEEAAARRVGRERQPEQSAFAAGQNDVTQIEEVVAEHGAAANGADAARLLDDVLHAAIEGILDERDRRGEAGRVDPQRAAGSAPKQHERQQGEDPRRRARSAVERTFLEAICAL